jgi:G:T/U-mismatch repair DNA glycosylase
MQQEIHPWNWYCPSEAKSLIIGTFPPTLRNWSFDFFYPNKNNYFWKIMARITPVNRALSGGLRIIWLYGTLIS